MRMDGTMRKLEDRQQRINTFQKNDSYKVFLLTTQVGGVGLTLTGADRVVICKYRGLQCRLQVIGWIYTKHFNFMVTLFKY